MKAVVQSYGKGELTLSEVPPPALRPGGILVHNAVSLISAGTERQMVGLAQKSLLGKARQRPDLVRKVFEKLRRDGPLATLDTVRSRLDTPIPLGYSSAGTVIAVGEGAGGFRTGDRVACAGAGYASHAETIFVPKNLAVPIPDDVDFEAAAFTTVGAIALEGLRLARIELGETVAVIGLGLVGVLAAQLARAAGCRVIGMDTSAERCRLALGLGLDGAVSDPQDLVERCREATGGHGADKVIVAAATDSSQPIELAGEAARPRAVVVAVGAVGMEVPRTSYYNRELTLRVSRSYGPGRYDPDYEEKGRDYPIAYVRWTENRNMEAFVQQLAARRIDVAPLVSHRFPIAEAVDAYALLTGSRATGSRATGSRANGSRANGKGSGSQLGILLTYPPAVEVEGGSQPEAVVELPAAVPADAGGRSPATRSPATRATLSLGVLGAGQFASAVLLPELARLPGATLQGVAAATGIKAEHAARKFGFRFATTSESEILERPGVDAVVIATRHHLHARQVIAALAADKDVFVEKPLCLTEEELTEIESVYAAAAESRGRPPLLMVGYNRRFAPMSQRLKEFFAAVDEPLVVHYRVNAGPIPLDHWTQDPEQGGGRILGEVCHFIDYLTFLTGEMPRRVSAHATPDGSRYRDDNLVATVELTEGSLGTVTYVASGDTALPKERIEVFGGGSAAVLDNFRHLELARDGRRRVERSRLRQDKGHRAQMAAFVEAARTGAPAPIPWDEILAVSRATFAVVRCLRQTVSPPLDPPRGTLPVVEL